MGERGRTLTVGIWESDLEMVKGDARRSPHDVHHVLTDKLAAAV